MADNKYFDRRIVNRNIKRGMITTKDYEQFLNKLEDVRDKSVPLSGEEEDETENSEAERV